MMRLKRLDKQPNCTSPGSFTRPTVVSWRALFSFTNSILHMSDLTSIRNQIKDLDGRSASLRGYL